MKIKLSGFLNTAVYYALHKLYSENGLELPKVMTYGYPANMRMRYEPKIILTI